MFIFKCKMCGGTLEIQSGETVAVCEYCGTRQTLPKLDDDRKANLYDRANHFRRNNEFDKAMSIYEQILTEDKDDAEAYWSLVLCRYGIEYVEDPVSHKRVPTVNRVQFTSAFMDENYKSAVECADSYQKEVYEAEVKAIDEIQKGILAISQKEEPFDVFICYKEIDNNGRRTPDSVLANDLYHELTKEGFKVFFSRITLEDKLGSAYEPYIFAALNSAKIMVVLGTKLEYFNAVWVKNEWSRYLVLIEHGAKKMLIPAYKDMDPYNLPEEFSHLQAQDMSKLGFMHDLIRGIKKIIAAEAPKTTVKETVVVNNGNGNTTTFLKRAFMFLEDGDWISANEYCEKALDLDPENAQGYLGKLMTELKICKQDALVDSEEPFDESNNYQKAFRFADDSLKSALTGYIQAINDRNEKNRLEGIYARAVSEMNSESSDLLQLEHSIALFESVSGWKDSSEKSIACRLKIEKIKAEQEGIRLEQERKAEADCISAEKRAKRIKKTIAIVTPIAVVCIAFIIVLITVIIPTVKYNNAKELQKNAILTAQKGDTVKFGYYEQDNSTSNGSEQIEWIILEKQDEKVLLISKFGLDCQPYNTDHEDVTWETCSIRKWLNSNFINVAFSDDEKAMIPSVTISNPDTVYGELDEMVETGGNNTTDQIFLLSIDEANAYFSSYRARTVKSTVYANAQGALIKEECGNAACWWLRSPSVFDSYSMYCAATVVFDVGVWPNYCNVDMNGIAVRPALWVNLGT